MSQEEYRYFFVSYAVGQLGFGNLIIPQRHQTDGLPDNGMNIPQVTMHLMERFKAVIVILYWQETTKKRYDEYQLLLNKLSLKFHGPSLVVHPGGKPEHSPPGDKPNLKSIESPVSLLNPGSIDQGPQR